MIMAPVMKELKNLQKDEGVKDFINRIEEICSPENLSSKEVIYLLVIFLGPSFPVSILG